MKHRATALWLLFAGMAASYAYYSAPTHLKPLVHHLSTSGFILFLLLLVGLLHRSWEIWAVCAVLAGFRLMIAGCSIWFAVDPWPVKEGDPLCSARADWPLGVVGLIIAMLLLLELTGRSKR